MASINISPKSSKDTHGEYGSIGGGTKNKVFSIRVTGVATETFDYLPMPKGSTAARRMTAQREL